MGFNIQQSADFYKFRYPACLLKISSPIFEWQKTDDQREKRLIFDNCYAMFSTVQKQLVSKIEKVEAIDDDYIANWTLVSYLENGDSDKYVENLNNHDEETEKLLQYLNGIIHEVVPTA